MNRTIVAALVAASVMACGSPPSPQDADGTGEGGAKGSADVASLGLPSGTEIGATTQRTISSKSDEAGATFTAQVTSDTKDGSGRVVIPAGSSINMTITELEDASNSDTEASRITVVVNSLTIGGQSYPVSAEITSMASTLEEQGVTAGEVEKTIAGAVAGGIVGRVVGGNAKGTVIGAVVGGVAGRVIGARGAKSAVVVPAGTPIIVTLDGPLTVR